MVVHRCRRNLLRARVRQRLVPEAVAVLRLILQVARWAKSENKTLKNLISGASRCQEMIVIKDNSSDFNCLRRYPPSIIIRLQFWAAGKSPHRVVIPATSRHDRLYRQRKRQCLHLYAVEVLGTALRVFALTRGCCLRRFQCFRPRLRRGVNRPKGIRCAKVKFSCFL